MPELPPFKPSVSVFHFTSKVSNAKIAKYRQATERGMTMKAGSKVALNTPAQDEEAGDDEDEAPASKRPRLRLNVREPSNLADDTIAVSRPRRSNAGKLAQTNKRKREWSAAFSDNEDDGNTTTTQHSHASPAESSDLSSCDSDLIAEHTAPPARHPPAETTAYGDFMSYYIQDDDDADNGPAPVPEHNSTTASKKRLKTAVKAPKPHQPPTTSTQAPKAQTAISLPPPTQQQTKPAPLPRPSQPAHPPALAPVAIDIREREPDTIAVMIVKLEALSTAINDFGGTSQTEESPSPPDDEDSTVDNFLAMFGGGGLGQPTGKQERAPKRFADFHHPGTQDEPLGNGIRFIMNALKSWAEQRLYAQRMQMLQNTANARRAAGKPVHDVHLPFMAPMNLFETPEGRAIQAFRTVVESGCLRVNTVIPLKLSKALRRLYLQIDSLINQTGKGQAPWRCLSYSAQIEAHRIRVQKYIEAQVKAQEDMIRQQQITHQQAMRSMGLPDHFTSTMFYHHSQDVEASDYGVRGNTSDLVRLPTDPSMRYNAVHRAQGNTHIVNGISGHGHPANPNDTAFLPRSGQSMKFSFAPSNDAVMKVFGAQSFPVPATPPVKREKTASATPLEEVPPIVRPSIEKTSTSPVVRTSGFSAVNKPAKPH